MLRLDFQPYFEAGLFDDIAQVYEGSLRHQFYMHDKGQNGSFDDGMVKLRVIIFTLIWTAIARQ